MKAKRKRTDNTARASRVTGQQIEDIYLFGEITDERAQNVLWMIHDAVRRDRLVRLWICSLGGDLGGALAIHDALARTPGSEAIATGQCQSAALVAFLGAEKRRCTPNTIFMSHEVTGRPAQGIPEELRMALALLARCPPGTFDGLLSEQPEQLPDGSLGLPALKKLETIRAGMWGPDLAKELKVVTGDL